MQQLTQFTSAGGEVLILCHCCKDYFDADEFTPEMYPASGEIETQYGGPVCLYCMDEMVKAEDTGRWGLRDDLRQDLIGEWWENPTESENFDWYGYGLDCARDLAKG